MEKQKLYQWLQGSDRGKIVSLVGIDAEDNVTYLRFDDGSRCNVEFAAKLNDPRAYSDGKFVAEVCDRKNIWTFEDKSIRDDVRYGQLKDTGEIVEGWDPYTHGREGNLNKARKSTKAIPPRHVITENEMQAGAEKLKELGISPNTPGYEQGIKNLTVPTQESLLSKMAGKIVQNNTGGNYENVEKAVYDDKGNLIGKTTIGLDPTGAKAPSLKDIEHLQRASEIYIPEDLKTPSEIPAKDVEISVTKKLDATVETILEKKESIEKKSSVDTSSPIYSIVSKCKKKDVKAPLTLDLKLPGKSIYNLIKEEYEDDAIDEFFEIIIDQISIDEIKESIKKALRASYEYTEEKESVIG